MATETLCRSLRSICLVVLGGAFTIGCQGYPFESREPERVSGHQLNQNVGTPTPADILFVIDNSGSMLNQRQELISNMGTFITQMAQSDNDFHFGIVTTDVECNIPERDCANAPNLVSAACCALVTNGNLPVCEERDTDGDGSIDWSNCDAGRLRGPLGAPPFFSKPSGDANGWIAQVSKTISDLGCNGSGYESGLEAARRMIACAQNNNDCPSASIAQLNAGFLRAEADLVVIFVTDEDDCSFTDPNAYLAPSDATDPAQQAAHLCSPAECYAYYGADLDANGDGVQDWADPTYYAQDGGNPPLYCGSSLSPTYRTVNPPTPSAIQPYIDYFVAAKGGDISRVRAAGIVSAVADANQPLRFRRDACVNIGLGVAGTKGLGVTNACGCWSASAVASAIDSRNPYCAVTSSLGSFDTPQPQNIASNECSAVGAGGAVDANGLSAPLPGCKAMPSGRYVTFLETLSQQRTTALLQSNTLVDSICNADYGETMFDIVNTVILNDCFTLGIVPASATDIDVRLGGKTLPQVDVGASAPGWSFRAGSGQVCLEGGLHKALGDQFAIFVIQP
jgi:hypothetical protein